MLPQQRQALAALLQRLFDNNLDLQLALQGHPHVTTDFINGLPPAQNIPVAHYQFAVLKRLSSFGIVDRSLFEVLAQARPRMREDIVKVAKLFELTIEFPKPDEPNTQKVVFLSASGDSQLGYIAVTDELRAVADALTRAKQRERFELIKEPEVTYSRAVHLLDDLQPAIVHIGAHGQNDVARRGIYFVGNPEPVTPEVLASLFATLKNPPQLAIFMCCESIEVARQVANYTGAAIGFAKPISNLAAQVFSAAFYERYGAGRPLANAFELAKNITIGEGQADANSAELFVHTR